MHSIGQLEPFQPPSTNPTVDTCGALRRSGRSMVRTMRAALNNASIIDLLMDSNLTRHQRQMPL